MTDKKLELKIIKEEAQKCVKCPELVKNRTQVVFGEGNPDAEIMFVGEGAGRNEDERGRPFVGAAGKLLDNIIKACGWIREELYIANCVNCRPPNNRIPTKTECDNCRNYLESQISIVNPKFLILLGSTASSNILGVPISRTRGIVHHYKGIKTVTTYHPAFLLRQPEKKKDVWEDLQVVIHELKRDNHEDH